MSVTLCLGEALVDMIGEAPAASVSEVPRFVPHFGGATANVAVFAARAGAQIALAGSAGDDEWGRWLQARLDAEGIDAAHFLLVQGTCTQLAFVSVDERGEPTYRLYAELVEPLVDALGESLATAVDAAAGLFISSNTLVGAGERALTMDARRRALDRECPVVFDCNLRLHRWASRADAAASANACVPGSLLVHANRAEAELLTGESDPERASVALRKAGAELVVITLGAEGAMLRGAGLRVNVAGAPVDVVSTIGAGDALTGTLLARLALSGFYPAAAAAALDEAVAASATACGAGAPLTRAGAAAARTAQAAARTARSAARSAWQRPPARRVRAIRERLRLVYGIPGAAPHGQPIAELILTVLSQSTNDRNRDVAYFRLRDRYPDWESVRDAPVDEIEEAIRPGGISKVKSARIKSILTAITETTPHHDLQLSWLADESVPAAQEYLTALPGVGRKTAACVLLFALGMRDVPVDTHVSRVGTRLGLFRPGAPFEEMHDEMLALTPAGAELELHMNLLRHGRRTCHARRPECRACALARMCPSAGTFG